MLTSFNQTAITSYKLMSIVICNRCIMFYFCFFLCRLTMIKCTEYIFTSVLWFALFAFQNISNPPESTRKRKVGVFKYLPFEERFRQALFSCRFSVEGRPSRRNKVACSHIPGVLLTLPRRSFSVINGFFLSARLFVLPPG